MRKKKFSLNVDCLIFLSVLILDSTDEDQEKEGDNDQSVTSGKLFTSGKYTQYI